MKAEVEINNNEQVMTLEARLFSTSARLSATTLFVLLLSDLLIFQFYDSVLIEIPALLVCLYFVVSSRNPTKIPRLIIPFLIFMQLTLNLGFFFTGGFYISISLLFLVVFFLSIILIKKQYRKLFFFISVANFFILGLYEYLNPSIRVFVTDTTTDLITSDIIIVITLTLASYIMIYVKNKYEEVRREAEIKNELLGNQKLKLNELNAELQLMNTDLEGQVIRRTRKVNEQNKRILEYASMHSNQVDSPLSKIELISNNLEKSDPEFIKKIDSLWSEATALDRELISINTKLEGEEEGDTSLSNNQ